MELAFYFKFSTTSKSSIIHVIGWVIKQPLHTSLGESKLLPLDAVVAPVLDNSLYTKADAAVTYLKFGLLSVHRRFVYIRFHNLYR